MLQTCSTLCDTVNCSLPGSSVHGILRAIGTERIGEKVPPVLVGMLRGEALASGGGSGEGKKAVTKYSIPA